MTTCSVAGCCNSTKNRMKNVRYFRFPKNEAVKKKWYDACGKREVIFLKVAFICSIHFEPSCFKMPLNVSYSGRYLKNDAVPTINLPKTIKNTTSMKNQTDIRQIKNDITSEKSNQDYARLSNEYKFIKEQFDVLLDKKKEIDEQLASSKNTKEKLQIELNRLQKELSMSKSACTQVINEKNEFEKKFHTAETNSFIYRQNVDDRLAKLYSNEQIQHVLGSKKKSKWSNEDYVNGLALKNISESAYKFLLENNHPFPPLSSLQRFRLASNSCQDTSSDPDGD